MNEQETGRTYNVGDEVWWVNYILTKTQELCSVCFGEKWVTLILGNGDRVALPCRHCTDQHGNPTGYTTTLEYVATPQLAVISRCRIEITEDGEKREYGAGDNKYFLFHENGIYDTEEEAMAICKSLRENERAKADVQKEQERAESMRRLSCSAAGKSGGV